MFSKKRVDPLAITPTVSEDGGGGALDGFIAITPRGSLETGRGKKLLTAGGGGGAVVVPDARPEDDAQLDELVGAMLEAQGEKDMVRSKVMELPPAHKWALLSNYKVIQAPSGAARGATTSRRGSLAADEDNSQDWADTISLDPSLDQLQELAVLLRSRPLRWVIGFVVGGGVGSLVGALSFLQRKTFKTPDDLDLLAEMLRCLRALMNTEVGMRSVLNLPLLEEEEEEGEEGDTLGALPSSEGGGSGKLDPTGAVAQLALCAEPLNESATARKVASAAMVLISAAALYSDKGHGQVLAALELARRGRRRLNRFGWLLTRHRRARRGVNRAC